VSIRRNKHFNGKHKKIEIKLSLLKNSMDTLKIKSLGQIQDGSINFGDLTLFVGPQASGKSIILQLIKLIVDKKHIRKTLEQYGYIWSNKIENILDRYFGEGMSNIWRPETAIEYNGAPFTTKEVLPKKKESIKDAVETLFYIPAQRVVCIQNGWPRFFTDYEDSVPYVLRQFSETLRQSLENGMDKDVLFPMPQRLKEPLRDSFNSSIFHNGKIRIDKTGKKRFKLDVGKSSIPFMAWSAGQKEFMPMLLSFYGLCPSSKASRKDSIRYVILEEPEMGLHPEAIQSVILQIIDLMSRDYKVIVSTHSPVLLEFAWAFNIMKEAKLDKTALSKLFNLKQTTPIQRLFKDILETKTVNTFYFDRQNDQITIKDISSLDAGSDDLAIAEWGGLSSFSAKATEIVLNIAAHED
jgi:predicted ATP-binding protein involved in virulence